MIAALPPIHNNYATCYDLRGFAHDGHPVNKRMAASNYLRPGTKIRLVGKQAGPHGVRRYVIHDTGPALADGHFDLWAASGCTTFGKKPIRYVFGWKRRPL